MQIQQRQIQLQNILSKHSRGILLSKIKNRDTLTFKSRYELQQTDNSLSKKHINATQKQTKKREFLSQTP